MTQLYVRHMRQGSSIGGKKVIQGMSKGLLETKHINHSRAKGKPI